MKLRRIGSGEYGTADDRFRVIRNWGDSGDRHWVLFALGWFTATMDGKTYMDPIADVVWEGPRLTDARAELDRLYAEKTA